jgi:predicted DNA-binding transcriptional regulator AlpA
MTPRVTGQLVDLAWIAERFEVAYNSAWRWTQRDDFPSPAVELGGRRGWRVTDVEKWGGETLPLGRTRKDRRPTVKQRRSSGS